MKKFRIFIFLFFLKDASAQLLDFTCDPASDCSSGVGNGYVPDPENCENYYVCIFVGGELVPSTNPLSCPAGQYFDLSIGDCAIEDVPGTCGSNICPEPDINVCETMCPPFTGEITTVANKNNCTTYFVCVSTGPTEVSCPSDNMYYDGENCNPFASKCCDFCSAYCSTTRVQIVDPCDCHSYYICLDIGPAENSNRFTCDPGSYYDEATAQCLIGACSNFCSNSACGITGGVETTAGGTQTTAAGPTSTTTRPAGNCDPLSSFTCPAREGNYPRCPYCDQSYFHCSLNEASQKDCPEGTVFNTNAAYPYCIQNENCPYP